MSNRLPLPRSDRERGLPAIAPGARGPGFTPAGDAYVVKEQSGTSPAVATLFLAPLANAATGETAVLTYGVRATGEIVALAVIGDENQSPTYGLIVAAGQVQEVLPDQVAAPSAVRAMVINAQPQRLSCKQCSGYCKFASALTGIVLAAMVAVVLIGTGGLGLPFLLAGALAGGLFAGGGLVASQFCPQFCGCVYCNCNETCYNTASECTSNCRGGLSCLTGICRPPQPFEC